MKLIDYVDSAIRKYKLKINNEIAASFGLQFRFQFIADVLAQGSNEWNQKWIEPELISRYWMVPECRYEFSICGLVCLFDSGNETKLKTFSLFQTGFNKPNTNGIQNAALEYVLSLVAGMRLNWNETKQLNQANFINWIKCL